MTPRSPSQRASAMMSCGRRDTNAPRNIGIAQNAHRRSQPLAILSGAQGRPSSRARITRGPDAGTGPSMVTSTGAVDSGSEASARATWGRWDAVARQRHPGRPALALHRRQRQQLAAVGGHVRGGRVPVEDGPQVGGHVGVGVEPQHGVGLGQLVGELLAVALGQAADRDDLLRPGVPLAGGGLEEHVDRVLLGLLDEAAGVDHRDVRVVGVVDEQPPLGGQAAGELLGVDLVAGAPQGHQGDAALRRRAHGAHSKGG